MISERLLETPTANGVILTLAPQPERDALKSCRARLDKADQAFANGDWATAITELDVASRFARLAGQNELAEIIGELSVTTHIWEDCMNEDQWQPVMLDCKLLAGVRL